MSITIYSGTAGATAVNTPSSSSNVSKLQTPPVTTTTTPDISEDPFGSAPFSLPAGLRATGKKSGGKA